MSEDREIPVKIVLIGDSGVGKTSISRVFTTDTMNMDQAPTVGASFTSKSWTTPGGVHLKLNIWDTAGQERFRSLAPIYYRDSHAVVIVYSLADRKTFENLPYWLDMIQKNLSPQPFIVFVGNKTDLPRQVDQNEAQGYAREVNCQMVETSAVTREGIEELFSLIADKVTDREPSRCAPELRTTTQEHISKRRSECC